MSYLEEKIEQALVEALDRQEKMLARMSNMLWHQLHIADITVTEIGTVNNSNNLTVLAQSQNTEIIRSVFLFIDSTVGGTFTLTLGNIIIPLIPCPVSGLFQMFGTAFVCKQNAVRSIVVVPSSNPPKYMTLLLFGEYAGNAGWMN